MSSLQQLQREFEQHQAHEQAQQLSRAADSAPPSFQEEFCKVFHKVIPDLFALKRDGFNYAELYAYARRNAHRYTALQRRRGLLSVAELLHLMLLWAIYKRCLGIVRQLVPLLLARTRLHVAPRFHLLPVRCRAAPDDDDDDDDADADDRTHCVVLAGDANQSASCGAGDASHDVEAADEDELSALVARPLSDEFFPTRSAFVPLPTSANTIHVGIDTKLAAVPAAAPAAAPAVQELGPIAACDAESSCNDASGELDEVTMNQKMNTLLESFSAVLVDHDDFEVNALSIALCRNRLDVLQVWAECDRASLVDCIEENLCVAARLAHKVSPDLTQFLHAVLLESGRHSQEDLTMLEARCGQIAFFDSAHFRRLPWCLAVACSSWRLRDIAPLLDDARVNRSPQALRGGLLAASARASSARVAQLEASRIVELLLASRECQLTPKLCEELLSAAVRNRQPRIVEAVMADARFDASRCGPTLLAAAAHGLLALVHRLLHAPGGALPFATCRDALTVAAGSGHLSTVKLLLRARAGLACDASLAAAVQHGQLDVARELLRDDAFARSAAVTARADLLCAAAENGHVPMLRLLLRRTLCDPSGDAPIRAAMFGQLAALRVLMADARVQMDGWQNLALKFASYNCHTTVLQYLLTCAGVDPAHDDSSAARWCRSVACLKVLLADGRVDTGARQSELIFSSARDGKEALVELLLKDPHTSPEVKSNRVLYSAVRKNRVRIVRMLLNDPRVDPTDRDYRCYTLAVRFGRSACLEALLEDPRGQTLPPFVRASLLDFAIKYPTSDGVRMLELLLRRSVVDANFMARHVVQQMPLTQAVLYTRGEMVELLVRCGADVERTLADIDESSLQTSLRSMLERRRSVRELHADTLRASLCVLRYGRIIIRGLEPIFGCLTHWLTADILGAFDEHGALSERHMHFLVQTLQQRRFFGSRVDFGTELLLVDGESERWIAQLMTVSLERLLPQARKQRKRLTLK
jgi:hypothetical protein